MATRRRARGGGLCGSKQCPIKPSESMPASAAKPAHVKLNETAAAARIAEHTRTIDAKQRQINGLETTIAAKVAQIRAIPPTEENRSKRVRILKSKKLDEKTLESYKSHLKGLKAMKETYEQTIKARRQYDVAIALGRMNNAARAQARLRQLNMNMTRRTGPALQKFKNISRKHGLRTPKRSASAVVTVSGVGLNTIANSNHSSNSSSSSRSSKSSSSGNSLRSNPNNNATTKDMKRYIRTEMAKVATQEKDIKATLKEQDRKLKATSRAIASMSRAIAPALTPSQEAALQAEFNAL